MRDLIGLPHHRGSIEDALDEQDPGDNGQDDHVEDKVEENSECRRARRLERMIEHEGRPLNANESLSHC